VHGDSSKGTLKIANTTLRNNGSLAVRAENGANVSISGTKMLGNVVGGVYAASNAVATTTVGVSDSIISGGTEGVYVYTTIADAIAKVFVTRCTIENLGYALDSQTTDVGSTLISLSNSMIARNGFAWNQNGVGSVIESSGNNHIRGNLGTFGTLTPVGLQ